MKKIKEFFIDLKKECEKLLEISLNFEKLINVLLIIAILILAIIAIVNGLNKPLFTGEVTHLEGKMDKEINFSLIGIFKYLDILNDCFANGYYNSLSEFSSISKESVISMSNAISTLRMLDILVIASEAIFILSLAISLFDGSDVVFSSLVIAMNIFFAIFAMSSYQEVGYIKEITNNYKSIFILWGVIFILTFIKLLYNIYKNKHLKAIAK